MVSTNQNKATKPARIESAANQRNPETRMKIALAATLLACCFLQAAVAYPQPPPFYSQENLFAYLSSRQPVKPRRYETMQQDAKPAPSVSTSLIFKARKQDDGPPNFAYQAIDDEGCTADCGCYLLAQVERGGRKVRQRREVDNQAAKAHIQTISLPSEFYEVDQYGQLSVCKCEEIPAGDVEPILVDFANEFGR